MLRGPLAKERLERRGEEVVLGLKRAWSDGSTALVMSPLAFTAKLASTVPPPHANTVVYHGIFAARHRWRRRVVPAPKAERPRTVAARRGRILARHPSPRNDGKAAWAELLRHTFGKDGFACPSCGRPMKLRAVVLGPPASLTIVAGLMRATGPP